MKIVIPGTINIETGVVTPSKELEFVPTPKPSSRPGIHLEEWIEETETQIIQHWEEIKVEATPEDYEDALLKFGVSV